MLGQGLTSYTESQRLCEVDTTMKLSLQMKKLIHKKSKSNLPCCIQLVSSRNRIGTRLVQLIWALSHYALRLTELHDPPLVLLDEL